MPYITGNGSTGALNASILIGATSLTLASGHGARFPTVAAPDVMMLSITDGTNTEIVQCTAHTAASDTFTIARNAEQVRNASANFAFNAGAVVACVATKGMLEYAQPLWLQTQAANPTLKAGGLQVYGRSKAGRVMLKGVAPSGVDYEFQPSLFTQNVILYKPNIGATATGTGIGGVWAGSGTASHPALATTAPAIVNASRRTRFASAASANSSAGIILSTTSGQSAVWRGNAAGLGGFFFHARVVDQTAAAAGRMFVGLTALTTAILAAEPTAANNTIGFGFNAADATTNYFIIRRDATTAATVALSTVTARAVDKMFDVWIFAAPNDSGITIRVDTISTAGVPTTVHEATYTTNIPVNTAFLIPQVLRGTGALTAAQTMDVLSVYVESDY